MSATIFILPVVARPNFTDPDWREQHQRECRAQIGTQFAQPHRTRPLLVIHNREIAAPVTRDNFRDVMRDLVGAFADDVDPKAR